MRAAVVIFGAALAACGPSAPVVDAGGGAADARLIDARADSALPDGTRPDSSMPDAAAPDASGGDAGGCTIAAFVLDGALDASAPVIAGGVTSVRLAVTVTAAGVLSVATDDAGEGSDHFVLVSGTAPGTARAAPFGKSGTVAAGTGPLLFLADENDNDFEGWFRRDTGSGDTLLSGAGYAAATGANGGVLEGTLDLAVAFGTVPTTVYLAAVPYASADGGSAIAAAQTPTGDGDGDVEVAEYLTVSTACP